MVDAAFPGKPDELKEIKTKSGRRRMPCKEWWLWTLHIKQMEKNVGMPVDLCIL